MKRPTTGKAKTAKALKKKCPECGKVFEGPRASQACGGHRAKMHGYTMAPKPPGKKTKKEKALARSVRAALVNRRRAAVATMTGSARQHREPAAVEPVAKRRYIRRTEVAPKDQDRVALLQAALQGYRILTSRIEEELVHLHAPFTPDPAARVMQVGSGGGSGAGQQTGRLPGWRKEQSIRMRKYWAARKAEAAGAAGAGGNVQDAGGAETAEGMEEV